MICEFEKRRDLIYSFVNDIKFLFVLKFEGVFYIWVDIFDIIGKSFEGKLIDLVNMFVKFFLEVEKVVVVLSEGFGMENYIRFLYVIFEKNIREGVERIKRFVEKLI